MINVETLKFCKLLEELKKKSAVGIKPFATATEDSFDNAVFYADAAAEDSNEHKVVSEAYFVDGHHDIVAFYDDTAEYKIRAHTDDGAYVKIQLQRSDTLIVIEDGEWDFK